MSCLQTGHIFSKSLGYFNTMHFYNLISSKKIWLTPIKNDRIYRKFQSTNPLISAQWGTIFEDVFNPDQMRCLQSSGYGVLLQSR